MLIKLPARIELDRSLSLLLGLWTLTLISLPIVRWVAGMAALQHGIVVSVLIQVLVVLVILWRAWGGRRALWIGTIVVFCAWAVEAIGRSTGWPFGAYDYTPVLQPQLAGVPWLIPLAWLMMLPPAWAVARVIASQRRLAFIGVSALAFTAWDLFLDPQMVAWNFWEWAEPGGYFGIPWVNFLGWMLASGLITALVNPPDLPVVPLVIVYALTWALEFVGQLFFWQLPGPAIVGFVGMGSMLLWALLRFRRRRAE